ncbi:MAG: DUF3147 family protein [Candidatus Methylomirabilales bacterium]
MVEPGIGLAFWGKLALGFVVGSGWVAWSTVAAERQGPAVGGLIGGLPSTILVSLLFIGVTQTPRVAAETTTLIPLIQGINGVFVLVYLAAVRRGLAAGLSAGLGAWVALAGAVAAAGLRDFAVSLAGWAVLAVGCYLVAERLLAIPPGGKLAIRCTRMQIAARAVFGGTVIATAVLTAKLFGPSYGGIFAAFPATFFSSLVVTHRAGGRDFSRAVGKAMMTSGMINAALYSVAVRYAYPGCGLILGTAASLAFSGLTAYCTYRFMRATAPAA